MIKNLAPAAIGPLDELAKNICVKHILGYDSLGAFFLSRVKTNAVIEIIEVNAGLDKKKYVGQDLGRRKIVDPG